jgi:GTP:adenosylcobinamide-phosphate guanylyltransferase
MTLRVTAIIQGRMSSSRLPGKILADIGGQPMLSRVFVRTARAATVNGTVFATTTDASDDPVAEYCGFSGIPCRRGSLYDVLDRYYQAARAEKAEVVVRITADCPVIDPDLVDDVVNTLLENEYDFVTNRLPEHTTIHWHGQRLPNGMDGVGGLTQPQIPAGKTYVYEFVARRPGTFMYHPHADEMVQMAMGMMGFWVTHPKGRHPLIAPVDRDFCFLLASYDIDPGSYTPKVSTMLDFNLFTFNSRVFPGIDSLNVRQNDRVRIRIGNLSMTSHPIHLHGHEFVITGTDGGPVPKAGRWPEVTADVAVGQMRQIEFAAAAEGDWAFHCHKSHHTMNAMGHGVPTMIGVDHRGVAERIVDLVPDYMAMGERGMADMGMMEMPLPDNTLPMMSGQGPYGSVEMGGMFTVVKVRRDQKPGDYADPGWYRQPAGSRAAEWTGPMTEAPRAGTQGGRSMPPQGRPPAADATVRKPGAHAGRRHGEH